MVSGVFVSDASIIVPDRANLQELMRHNIDWGKMNTLLFPEERLSVGKYHSGHFLVRTAGIVSNSIVYDVAARHFNAEKRLAGYYSVPIVSSNGSDARSMFRIAYEMLCSAGKRRVMVWCHGQHEPYLVDSDFSDKKIRQYVRPYLRLSINTVNDTADGERLEKRMNEIILSSRSAL